MFVRVITAPADPAPILTVPEAVAYCRKAEPSDPVEIMEWDRMIRGTEDAWELETGLRLRRQTVWCEGQSLGRSLLWVPVGPLVTVTSLTAGGSPIDVATAQIVSLNTIRLASLSSWPLASPYTLTGAIVLEADVGYANAAAVPADIKQALLQHIAHWDAHREAATSQTNVLEGAQTEALYSWRASLDRWRLMAVA